MLELKYEDEVTPEDFTDPLASDLVKFFNLYKTIVEYGKHRSKMLQFRRSEEIFADQCALRGWKFLFGNPVTIWDAATGATLLRITLPSQTQEEFRSELVTWKRT